MDQSLVIIFKDAGDFSIQEVSTALRRLNRVRRA